MIEILPPFSIPLHSHLSHTFILGSIRSILLSVVSFILIRSLRCHRNANSLHDEIVEIQVEIQKLFIECGNKYYAENEMELQKIELLESEQLARKMTATTAMSSEAPAATVATNPPSATIRPSLGCRAIVQRSLRMIDIVVRELSDWKEMVRLHSLKLLWQIVWHAEKAFTMKFAAILPVLCKCAQDDEANVVQEVERVAIVIGELLDIDDWLPTALQALEKAPSHVGTMRCFGHLFQGARRDTNMKQSYILTIATAIDAAELSYSGKSTYQMALLNLIVQLVDTDSGSSELDADEVNEMHIAEEHLFRAIVKTAASSYAHNVHGISERAESIYAQFCGTPANRRALQTKYGAHVIADNQDLELEYTDESAYVIRVYGYIRLFGFQLETYAVLGNSIQAVLEKGSADAKVKILAAIATVT